MTDRLNAAIILLLITLAAAPWALCQTIAVDAPARIYPGNVFGLSAACTGMATGETEFEVTVSIGGDVYDWITRHSVMVPLELNTAAAQLPADWCGEIPVYLRAYAYHYDEWTPVAEAEVEIVLTGPSPTPTPAATTVPTPTPGGPCRDGYAEVRCWNIPEMTDANKDQLNKTLLFCLQDPDHFNFIGVFHRYLQPTWPNGEWWPTWRLEAGSDGCVEEWNIWESDPLEEDEATFLITWTVHSVTVTHTGTGDSQALYLRNGLSVNQLGEQAACSNWGWRSQALAEFVSPYQCDEHGPPTLCPTPPPLPTPTPSMGAFGFVSGSAVIEVSGIYTAGDQPQILFCLSAADYDSGVLLRIADNSRNGQIRGQWCLGQRWADSGYYGPTLTDGEYLVSWEPGYVSVVTPAGDLIDTDVPWDHAPRWLDVAPPWGGHRLGEPSTCEVTVTSISWGVPGRMEGC